jgi:hypothetical protein
MSDLNLMIASIGAVAGLSSLVVSLWTLWIVQRRIGPHERLSVTQHGMYFDKKHGVYVDRPQDVSN